MQDAPSRPAMYWDEQGFVTVAVPVTRLVGWESSGPRDCSPEGKGWFEGGELVFAEVSLRGTKSGLVQMGTGVVAHAAETSRLCFGCSLLGLMLIEAW